MKYIRKELLTTAVRVIDTATGKAQVQEWLELLGIYSYTWLTTGLCLSGGSQDFTAYYGSWLVHVHNEIKFYTDENFKKDFDPVDTPVTLH